MEEIRTVSKRQPDFGESLCFLFTTLTLIIYTFKVDDDRFSKKARFSVPDESIEDKLDELIARIGEKVSYKHLFSELIFTN